MNDQAQLPPSRIITRETATALETDPITRMQVPVNDGLDDPLWLYQNALQMDGTVRRFAVRLKGFE